MKYKTKIKINGAELTDEQSSSASSITGVSLEASAGNGFQVGNSAASALSVTILKPYKTSFDGDRVEFYILPDGEDDESLAEKLEEEVGSAEETEHVEDNDETDDIETEEVDDGEGEEMTAEEEAEADAEDDIEESNLFDTMNGVEVTGEVTEEEAVPDPADWELFGVFYVYKQTNNRDGSITLRCYDGFQLLHGDYMPAIKSGTIQQFYDDIRTQCAEFGVTVDTEEFAEEENVTITWNQVCSFRQAIGYIAGLVGGYATFGDDDTLGIDYYAYNDRVLLLPELLDYKTTSAGETQIDGVVCTVNLRGDTVESGDGGQSITFYNPFATQQTVDSILEQYQGIRYIGANVKAKWDPSVRCGDLVRVMSEEEYRNYIAMGNAFRNSGEMTAAEVLNLKKELNAVGRTILVSSQRIDFGGETLTEITSYLPTEAEKANAPTSPNDAKFRIVTAELIKTNELVAEKATIKDLEATNAEVNNIKADYVNTGMLEAEAAKIAKAEIANATIKNAQIESINGNKIVNGSIVAAALSSEVIKNFANNNIYYQATEPTGDIKEGDLWFKTMTATSGDRAGVLFVWSGGAWQNKKFDSESILAKSVTAGEIASGTITAGEVDMDNLQTNLARIGDTSGKNVQITGTGVEIRDGEKTLASYGETSTIGNDEGNSIHIGSSGIDMVAEGQPLAKFGLSNATKYAPVLYDVINKNLTDRKCTGLSTYKLNKNYANEDELKTHVTVKLIYHENNDGALDNNAIVPLDEYHPNSYTLGIAGDHIKITFDENVFQTEVKHFRPSYEGDFSDVDIALTYPVAYGLGMATIGNRLNWPEYNDTGDFSLAIGTGNVADDYSMAIGVLSFAQAYSIACGNLCTAGANSCAFGYSNQAEQGNSFALGSLLHTDAPNQLVIGYKNKTTAEGITARFVVAGGSQDEVNEEEPYNSAAITGDGDVRIKGDLYAHCNDDSGGGLSFTKITSGTGTAKATTGSVSMQPNWWRCGNLVQMEFSVAATGAVNPGKNIATGNITGIPRPITSTGIRAVSYYGDNANVSYVAKDGGFTVRNCGKDALGKGDNAIGNFTYITDGTML